MISWNEYFASDPPARQCGDWLAVSASRQRRRAGVVVGSHLVIITDGPALDLLCDVVEDTPDAMPPYALLDRLAELLDDDSFLSHIPEGVRLCLMM